jgi:hypothetical protein
LSQPLRYDYEESQRILSNSIRQNDKERAIFKQKLEALLTFDAQSPGYFSGVGESEALLNEGLTLLGGDPATGKVGAGSWNGQGFTPIMSDWQQRVNDQWSKRVERQEQARAAEFEQAAQGRTYQRVQLASGAYQWLWVKDSGKITQEDLQFNEKYADYLAILNAPEENMVDEYYQNMLEELRTGINTKTGKPLTTLEQVQRWSAVASFVAVLAIGSYYSVKGLTGTKTTAKQPKSTTKATGPKAKLPSDTTQGRQLKVKKADIPAGKSRGIAAPKKASGANMKNNVPDSTLRHADLGDFNTNNRLINGGHGQSNIDYLKENNIDFNIVKEYPNGVRTGNIPSHKNKMKRTGNGQSWFPKEWNDSKIRDAGNHINNLPQNKNLPDGQWAFGDYDGVRVGIIKKDGKVTTIIPDNSRQP